MADTRDQDRSELMEEIHNLREVRRGSQLMGHMGGTARMLTSYILVITVALTAIGGLALASVV